MKKKYGLLFLILFLFPFKSTAYEYDSAQETIMQELTKEDALGIAQDYLKSNSLDKDFRVTKPMKIEEGDWLDEKDLWIIYFKSLRSINGNKIITVNKQTKEVKDRGRTKW